MSENLEKTIEKRRSIYNIGKKEVLAKDKVIELVEHSVKHCPSAFNSQSARVVVLFGKHHDKLWEIILEALKPLTPQDKFPQTQEKIFAFKRGYGTILFFEDETVVKSLQDQFKLYADNFPKWSLQSNGMLEYVVWTSLAKANVGATLQHYNPLINEKVAKEWNLPESWNLLAQMPFGSIESPADEKDFSPIEDRVKIYK